MACVGSVVMHTTCCVCTSLLQICCAAHAALTLLPFGETAYADFCLTMIILPLAVYTPQHTSSITDVSMYRHIRIDSF